MSILQIVETSPGRVRGLFRYLVGLSAQKQKALVLRGLMSPSSLPTPWPVLEGDAGETEPESSPEPITDRRAAGAQMIDKVINGCEKMGLVVREEDEIALNPALPPEARSEKKGDARLPLTISELVFDMSRSENHDLAQLISWYLLSDPLDAPGSEQSVITSLHSNPALQNHFGLKNQSYGQFEDWVVYLGFAWAGVSSERKRIISPDPTKYLRWILPAVFENVPRHTLPAAEVVRLVAERCPALDEGQYRKQLLELAGQGQEPGWLSPATSHAWLRLADEGFWDLLPRSDAGSPVMLTDGLDTKQIAAVRMNPRRQSFTANQA